MTINLERTINGFDEEIHIPDAFWNMFIFNTFQFITMIMSFMIVILLIDDIIYSDILFNKIILAINLVSSLLFGLATFINIGTTTATYYFTCVTHVISKAHFKVMPINLIVIISTYGVLFSENIDTNTILLLIVNTMQLIYTFTVFYFWTKLDLTVCKVYCQNFSCNRNSTTAPV